MKYANRNVEAAFALAIAGCVEAQVGDPEGDGPDWQALVRVSRTQMMLRDVDLIHYPHVQGGTTTLMWLVRHDDTITCHDSTDCDDDGYKERIAAMHASFATVTEFYNKPLDFDGLEDYMQDTAEYNFDFGEGVNT